MKNFMKRLIIIFFFFTLLFNFKSEAQWIQQNSGTNQNLYDIEFINEKTGWAVGDVGVVIKTSNGGINWINIPNPAVGKPLSSIHLVDSNYIYIVGWFETIIKSTDVGSNWIVIRNGNFGEGRSYDGLFFLNKDTGWICGIGYYILRTTDGGSTFDSSYLFWGELSDMYFKDFNNGIICADGAVFKTTNAGVNWFDTNVPTIGVFYRFNKLAVVNDTVWVAGGGNPPIYKSSDLCDTWIITDTIRNSTIYGLTFLTNQLGFAGGGLNKLFKTTNGGFNWIQENTGSGVNAGIHSIEFVNELTGWYVSGAGKIFHTTTGGQTLVNILNQNISTRDDIILQQNFPNPFNPYTTIEFIISENNKISLSIYDVNGKLVRKLINNEYYKIGKYSFKIISSELPSGVYYYTIESEKFSFSKKMLLIK